MKHISYLNICFLVFCFFLFHLLFCILLFISKAAVSMTLFNRLQQVNLTIFYYSRFAVSKIQGVGWCQYLVPISTLNVNLFKRAPLQWQPLLICFWQCGSLGQVLNHAAHSSILASLEDVGIVLRTMSLILLWYKRPTSGQYCRTDIHYEVLMISVLVDSNMTYVLGI